MNKLRDFAVTVLFYLTFVYVVLAAIPVMLMVGLMKLIDRKSVITDCNDKVKQFTAKIRKLAEEK